MTAFPNLTDPDLDALYSYIKTEGDKYITPGTKVGSGTDCCDSCDTYGKAYIVALREYSQIPQREESFFTLDRTFDIPAITDTTNTDTNEPIN